MINDTNILYESITKYRDNIYELSGKKILIENSQTISSLSFKFFRLNYLNDNEIFNAKFMKEDIYNLVRESSYKEGGITVVCILVRKNLYYYINGSYPYAMLN